MENESTVDDLLKQRKVFRIAILKMFNNMQKGTLPDLGKALSLQSDYDDIVIEVWDHNHDNNTEYNDKINAITKFLILYKNIDSILSHNVSSTTFKLCQTLFDELNKFIATFPGMIDLIHNLLLKLESSNLSSSMSNLNVSNNSHRSLSPLNSINLGLAVPNSSQIQPSQCSVHNVQPLLQLSPIATSQSPPINNVQNHGQPTKMKAENMPKFNGSAIQRPEFKDAAFELVINNTSIPTTLIGTSSSTSSSSSWKSVSSTGAKESTTTTTTTKSKAQDFVGKMMTQETSSSAPKSAFQDSNRNHNHYQMLSNNKIRCTSSTTISSNNQDCYNNNDRRDYHTVHPHNDKSGSSSTNSSNVTTVRLPVNYYDGLFEQLQPNSTSSTNSQTRSYSNVLTQQIRHSALISAGLGIGGQTNNTTLTSTANKSNNDNNHRESIQLQSHDATISLRHQQQQHINLCTQPSSNNDNGNSSSSTSSATTTNNATLIVTGILSSSKSYRSSHNNNSNSQGSRNSRDNHNANNNNNDSNSNVKETSMIAVLKNNFLNRQSPLTTVTDTLTTNSGTTNVDTNLDGTFKQISTSSLLSPTSVSTISTSVESVNVKSYFQGIQNNSTSESSTSVGKSTSVDTSSTSVSTSSTLIGSSSASVVIASTLVGTPSSSVSTSQSASSSNTPTETVIGNQSVITALAKTDVSSQYLQTLTTKINNIKTRVIFDGKSESSFITNKLVKLLNLPKFKTMPIRINGYGSNLRHLIGHYFTIMKLPDRDGNITEFKLTIDDTVCQFKFNSLPDIVQQQVNKMFSINFYDENIPVDILFGNGDINRFRVLNVDINIEPFIISKTSLGYIVHGKIDDQQFNIIQRFTDNINLPFNSMIYRTKFPIANNDFDLDHNITSHYQSLNIQQQSKAAIQISQQQLPESASSENVQLTNSPRLYQFQNKRQPFKSSSKISTTNSLQVNQQQLNVLSSTSTSISSSLTAFISINSLSMMMKVINDTIKSTVTLSPPSSLNSFWKYLRNFNLKYLEFIHRFFTRFKFSKLSDYATLNDGQNGHGKWSSGQIIESNSYAKVIISTYRYDYLPKGGEIVAKFRAVIRRNFNRFRDKDLQPSNTSNSARFLRDRP
ncbi:uncharacterized protein LOC142646197 [Dermatophagoides pteronyssinus]|uniref:uncharacterized protein LOC142646197 n=1 Tax=Dermatophagoides pteronyssinus TaxID=6956 RepID=UPI003F66D3C6